MKTMVVLYAAQYRATRRAAVGPRVAPINYGGHLTPIHPAAP